MNNFATFCNCLVKLTDINYYNLRPWNVNASVFPDLNLQFCVTHICLLAQTTDEMWLLERAVKWYIKVK